MPGLLQIAMHNKQQAIEPGAGPLPCIHCPILLMSQHLETVGELSQVRRMHNTAYRQDEGMAKQAFRGWPLQRIFLHALPHKVPELLAA